MLTCYVCGEPSRGRQHANRDTGYGVCVEHGQQCIDREGEAAALSYYGKRGYNWDINNSPTTEQP